MVIHKTVLYVAETACVLGCSAHYVYHLTYTGELVVYKEDGSRGVENTESSIYEIY